MPQGQILEKFRLKMKNAMMKYVLAIMVLLPLLAASVSATERTISMDDYDVTYSYDNVESDERFSLSVTILNNGDTKNNVVFELDGSDPFDVTSDERWDIGTLNEEEERSRTFRIEVDKDTDEDTYDLDFSLKDSKEVYDSEFDIDVLSDSADLVIADIDSRPGVITSNQEDVKITIKVDNIGSGDANSVRAELNLPKGFSPSSSFSNIANAEIIEGKSSREFEFFIDTEKYLESSNYQGELIVRYESGNENYVENLRFDIPVRGGPVFEVIDYKSNPSKVAPGESGRLDIRIVNRGEETGEETSVIVFENADYRIEFDQKTNFVGNIEPGEEGVASFNYDISDQGVAKNYVVKVQVRTVNDGNVVVDDFNVMINVYEDKKESNPLVILLVVMLVILIVAIVFVIRFLGKK